MKVAVIGANGQLGVDILNELNSQGIDNVGLVHADIAIEDKEASKLCLESLVPDVVINTAAFHNVPKCEDELAKAFEINGVGAKNLAELSNDLGFYLVHVSTDYVFDGVKNAPYLESDSPLPLNVYGNTKLAGEYFVNAISSSALNLRVSGIYGKSTCRAKGGVNFVELMLKFAVERDEVKVVDDEFLTPTSTKEIARQVVSICEKQPAGIAHATAEGSCSWYEFAKAIFEIKGMDVNLKKAAPGEFAMAVNRPKYSVLENGTLKDLGINTFKPWREGLEEYLLS